MDTLQYTHLMAGWHHKLTAFFCITSNVTKVYFIELKMNSVGLHCVQEKTLLFDYNCGIPWSIFILFVPVETGMNILQRS